MSQRSRATDDGRHVLESAIASYANDLRHAGILPHDMPVHEAVERIKVVVDFGFLVPCSLVSDEPCILFVPRSTTAAYGGPFEPATLLAPADEDALG